MRRIIIAGTGANQWSAQFWYTPLAKALDATVVCLANLGLDHPKKSVEKISKLTGDEPCQLIGHSQGGLIAIMAAKVCNIDKLVSICAPLKGVPYPSLALDFPGLAYMRSSNAALAELIGNDSMMTISSEIDFIVPPKSAHLDGTKQVYLDNPGHTWMPRDPNMIQIVKEFLDD